MARWGEEVIERVKEASDVVDVLSQYLPLTRAGSNFKGLCPFHHEKTPSFMVSPSRQMWHCFGCGEGGDVIRFVMRFEGLPFTEAVRKLADKGGVALPEPGDAPGGSGEDARAPLFRANRLAAAFYQAQLTRGDAGARARDYLSGRGIHAEVCKTFGVGYAPPGWQTLSDALAGDGVSPATLVSAGLAIVSDKGGEAGKRPYDRFRDRIVFPIRDLAGRVLGFGGRTMDPDGTPKYLNSPETAVYHKGDFLYGLDLAAPHIRSAGEVALVEGYLDVITLHQAGMGNAVGVLGTALTQEQAHRLRRVAPRVVLLFDGDAAGVKAALRSGLILLDEGVECLVAPLPAGEDPDSFLRQQGVEALRKAVREGVPLLTFVLREARRANPGESVPERMKVFDAIRPFMAKMKNKVEFALYLEEAARALGVAVEAVRAEVMGGKPRAGSPPSPSPRPREAVPRKPLVVPGEEKLLLRILLRHPSLVPRLGGELDPGAFSGPGMTELAASLKEGPERLTSFLAAHDDLSGLVSGWEMEELPLPEANLEREARGCLRRIERRRVEADLSALDLRLAEREGAGAERGELDRLLAEKQRLQARCQELRRS